MFPALCTIMVIEMFEFSKQCGNPHRKLQTIIFNWFRLNRDNYWRGEVEIVRESDEDVESEIERSIFNMVMPTRVGRERLFTCPVEWEIFLSRWTDVPVSRRCQLVQLFIYYVRAISFRQTTTGNGIWAKLRMGTGIWYTPLQDRLIILLLPYISTQTVAQIVQLLNNSDTLFWCFIDWRT